MKNVRENTVTTLNIITGTLVSLIKNNFPVKTIPREYITIENYTLKTVIAKKEGFTNFFTGMYTYKDKKVFIKTWSGRIKDINYYLLINEYKTGVILTKKMRKLPLRKKIAFSQIVDYAMTANSFSIIYEYIDGKPLNQFSPAKQVQILHDVTQFLFALSKKLNKKDKIRISKRNDLFYYLSLPFITTLVVLLNRKNWRVIFRSFITSYKSLQHIRYADLTLAHRDLNPNNILLSKNTVYIIDCERVVLTIPHYDITHMIIAKGNKSIRKELFKFFQKSNYVYNSFLKNYICLHYILSVNHKQTAKNYYFRMLNNLQ